jgi:hypothetical protein
LRKRQDKNRLRENNQDAGLHNEIQAASSNILDFLDDIIAAPVLSAEELDSVIVAFASMGLI